MKLNPSIKNMSNEYIFFTDQTALTFRICLVYYDARNHKQKKGNNVFVSLRSAIPFVLDESQNHKVCIRHKVRTQLH